GRRDGKTIDECVPRRGPPAELWADGDRRAPGGRHRPVLRRRTRHVAHGLRHRRKTKVTLAGGTGRRPPAGGGNPSQGDAILMSRSRPLLRVALAVVTVASTVVADGFGRPALAGSAVAGWPAGRPATFSLQYNDPDGSTAEAP